MKQFKSKLVLMTICDLCLYWIILHKISTLHKQSIKVQAISDQCAKEHKKMRSNGDDDDDDDDD